jgi:hypothetical protein
MKPTKEVVQCCENCGKKACKKGEICKKKPLIRPSRPRSKLTEQGQKSKLAQPIRVSKAAKEKSWDLPTDLSEYVDPKDKKVKIEKMEIDELRQHQNTKVKEMGLPLMGANQGGLYPEEKSKTTELPETADYTERRPEQKLSQISEMVRYCLEKEGKKPVEVQAGFGSGKNNSQKLYLSTNDPDSQNWLIESLNPTKILNDSLQSGDEHVKQVALKTRFHTLQQEERRKAIKDRTDKEKLEKELKKTDEINDKFMSGPITVVRNSRKRHAEQNIAEAMYEDKMDEGEIAGTMIRCEGCSAELGSNLIDEKGQYITGRTYASQASPERHKKLFKQINDSQAKVATNRSKRSRSCSPPRLPSKGKKEDEQENPAEPRKRPAEAPKSEPPPKKRRIKKEEQDKKKKKKTDSDDENEK